MKIVGFQANGGLHLGVVEGDQVIDLQAVDSAIPSDLGEVLRRHNGDLTALKDAAKRAGASARRPLAGLKYGLPVATPGKVICLGLNYLEHVKEGSQRDNIPKFPTIFTRCNSSLVPHGEPIVRPPASPATLAATRARCANSSARRRSGTWARTSTAPAVSGPGW
jgi:2-keto-4-pentenoate hydratase/2-oxohepta-3-ene-1,7-dioic acid hydratase in catechol pathway